MKLAKLPILIVLQNAYDKGTLATKPYSTAWWWEFRKSRTGDRIRMMFWEYGVRIEELKFCNTTKIVGVGAKSKLPADPAHVRSVLKRAKPKIVVAMGQQAKEVLVKSWGGDLFCVPHPCYRFLTDRLLFAAANDVIRRLDFLNSRILDVAPERVEFRQNNGDFSKLAMAEQPI